MSDELLDILANSNKDIDNQKLMDYLSNKLSAGEMHEVEKALVDSEMMNDAVEGLQNFKNRNEIAAFAEQLNAKLQKQLEKRKMIKEKRRFKDMPWLYFSIILIILIILISFVVIWKHINP